jgi:3-isopropylmalate dehydrogenase
MEAEAASVESAVDRALDAGLRTRDLGGTASMQEALDAVLANL